MYCQIFMKLGNNIYSNDISGSVKFETGPVGCKTRPLREIEE